MSPPILSIVSVFRFQAGFRAEFRLREPFPSTREVRSIGDRVAVVPCRKDKIYQWLERRLKALFGAGDVSAFCATGL
jgi:hypothetical protein